MKSSAVRFYLNYEPFYNLAKILRKIRHPPDGVKFRTLKRNRNHQSDAILPGKPGKPTRQQSLNASEKFLASQHMPVSKWEMKIIKANPALEGNSGIEVKISC
jgi:hypothetical protein